MNTEILKLLNDGILELFAFDLHIIYINWNKTVKAWLSFLQFNPLVRVGQKWQIFYLFIIISMKLLYYILVW